jgi:hypothetical protein
LVDLYPEMAISWYAVGCYYYVIGKSSTYTSCVILGFEVLKIVNIIKVSVFFLVRGGCEDVQFGRYVPVFHTNIMSALSVFL